MLELEVVKAVDEVTVVLRCHTVRLSLRSVPVLSALNKTYFVIVVSKAEEDL